MWGLPFCFLICSFFISLPACFFIYLFLPFFIFYFFALSLCHSFYFFTIFLQPERKIFHVTLVDKLHWHFSFYMVCNGKTRQHRQIRCSGVFWLFRCSGAFRCSLVLVHALWNTPEHPRAPRNTGTGKKPRNTEFDDVVLIFHYTPCKK